MIDEDARVELLLVALDGTEFSEGAVIAARHLARRLDAVIELYSVVRDESEYEKRTKYLKTLRPRDVPSRAHVDVDPEPAGAIDRVVRALDNTALCLASRGSRLRSVVRGSVTTELLRVRADPMIVTGRSFDGTRMGKGMVACVTDDPSTPALVAAALQWSRMLRERCTVVTVAEDVPPALDGGPVHRAFGPDLDDVDRFLEHLVASFRARGEELDTHAIYDPIGPVSGLLDYLFDHPASLVTVGSRLHAVLGTEVLGRTATAFLRHSPTPVLTVPLAQ